MKVSSVARRRDVRFETEIPFMLHLVRGDSLSACKAIDYSQNGLRLATELNIPLGSYVQIKVEHREDSKTKVYELDARVIWRRNSTHPKFPWTVGYLLLKRKDFDNYQKLLSKHPQCACADRRDNDRREKLTIDPASDEQRGYERREIPSIKRRLMEQSFALDDWISTYRYQRVLQSASAPSVMTQNSRKIMLGSNNYLGLTQHPRVKEAAIKAIEEYGVGAGGVRMLSGSMDLHLQLEERLAQFKGTEACTLLPSGYMANFAALTALLLDQNDIVFNDELNHASIFDGCRATPAKIRFYRHGDVTGLKKRLAQYDVDKPKLIVTDGVFSMDGDVAPLQDIAALGKQYNAMVMVDDAHATGVIGSQGHGTAEYCGVTGQIDITVCTLSKALGGIGGAVCGSRQLTKAISNKVRAFLFTSALPPAITAGAIAALDVIDSEPDLVTNLHRNSRFLYQGLKGLGFNVSENPSAILPVVIGEERKTNELAALLDDLGVFVSAVGPPAVPKRLCRLRVSAMATHTLDELEQALNCFKHAGRKLGLI